MYTVLFRANENTVNFQVPIVNDEVGECPEDFFLDLVVPAAAAAMGVIKGIPDNATVNIADEDGECHPTALIPVACYSKLPACTVHGSKSRLVPMLIHTHLTLTN